MTARELVTLLNKVIEEDPTAADFDMHVEGCDCSGDLVGITIEKDKTDIWLRRPDGIMREGYSVDDPTVRKE